MPIYEYRCEDCRRSFEVLTAFADRERAQMCPSCESLNSRVQVSSFAAVGAGLEPLPMAAKGGGGCCGGSCGCG